MKRFGESIHCIIVLFLSYMMLPQTIQGRRQLGACLPYTKTMLFHILFEYLIISCHARRGWDRRSSLVIRMMRTVIRSIAGDGGSSCCRTGRHSGDRLRFSFGIVILNEFLLGLWSFSISHARHGWHSRCVHDCFLYILDGWCLPILKMFFPCWPLNFQKR